MVKGNKHTHTHTHKHTHTHAHTHTHTHTQMKAVNFIRLSYRQPSICFTIESPSMSVFFL